MSAAFAKRVLALLDLTELSDTCREDHVEALIQKALGPAGKPAAVCVWPQFVSLAARRLKHHGVKVAAVINFPKGGADVERAVEDAEEALADGADEIDLMLPYHQLIKGDEIAAKEMISAARVAASGKCLKVILETGVLGEAKLIRRASEIAIENGADFIKTSSGKTELSAVPEAAEIMLEVIKASGKPVGLKPSGGIATLDDARLYLDIAARIMGAEWARPATFRFGASGLHDVIVAVIDGRNGAASKAAY